MTSGCAVANAGASSRQDRSSSASTRRADSPDHSSSRLESMNALPPLRRLHRSKFEGNQLAVFHDARGLSAEQMQTITKEMNFSECTFILPAEAPGTDVRMRIFTPGTELPMAGHPVIGSTFALAELGVIKPRPEQLRVRPRRRPDESRARRGRAIACRLRGWISGRRSSTSRSRRGRRSSARPGAQAVAVDQTGLPIEEISCGNAFLIIPVKSRKAVDEAEADLPAMRKLKSAFPGGHVGALFFTTEPADEDVLAYSRMFAPSAGVIEDPGDRQRRRTAGLLHGQASPGAPRTDAVTSSTCRAWRWAGRAGCTCASRRTTAARSRACRWAARRCASAKERSIPDPDPDPDA